MVATRSGVDGRLRAALEPPEGRGAVSPCRRYQNWANVWQPAEAATSTTYMVLEPPLPATPAGQLVKP
jgi:hypothetical protein